MLVGHGESLALIARNDDGKREPIGQLPVMVERRYSAVEHKDGTLTLMPETRDSGFTISWDDE